MTPSVAIVGVGCRLPGADNPTQLWDEVVTGKATFDSVTSDESQVWGWDASWRAHPNFVSTRSALDGLDLFDADFFHVSRRDAIMMDPQQRILLEVAQMALDDAGITLPTGKRVGVFASCSSSTYLPGPLTKAGLWDYRDMNYSAMLGCDKDFLASRVSYLLNLQGPSMVIQTACSSSLTAVVVAREFLAKGACDLAIVGGTSISLPHMGGYLATSESIFSPSGVCRPFDAQSDGIIKGNGAAAVVLARSDEVDSATVYATLVGCALTNDGADRVGFSAPGVSGQAAVVAQAHNEARSWCDPQELAYIETHGTGTRLGDPIEIRTLNEGLDRVWGPVERPSVLIGSLKSTMGHLDAAAGIAALVKTCLVIQHGTVPPLAGFSQPNPLIDFGGLQVPTRAVDLEQETVVAGVSSFGMGGSNAHVVLRGQVRSTKRDHHIRPFSRTRFWPTPSQDSEVVVSTYPLAPAIGTFTPSSVLDLAREILLEPTLELDDNFFETGADSLAIVGLLAEFEESGARLDFTDIQQAPTARLLADRLCGATGVAPHGEPRVATLALSESNKPVPSSLVWLKQGTPNLFLIHPAGGTTVCYVDLASQMSVGVGGLNFPASLISSALTIRDLAAIYLDFILNSQPTGPLWIGGWSFGGNVAAEIALQLEKYERTDVHLVMIDSHPPHAYIGGRCREEAYVQSFPSLLRQLFPELVFRASPACARNPQEVLNLVESPQWVPSMIGQLEQFYKVWIHNNEALKTWLPDRMIKAPTLIVGATQPEPEDILNNLAITQTAAHEWESYLSRDPIYVKVPGNHYDVVREPQTVSIIAQAITQYMRGDLSP